MMLLSDTIVDFHLFYDGAVDIQIWALLTRSECKVSDTQVIFKAHGPLIINYLDLFHLCVCIYFFCYFFNIFCQRHPFLTSWFFLKYHYRWRTHIFDTVPLMVLENVFSLVFHHYTYTLRFFKGVIPVMNN